MGGLPLSFVAQAPPAPLERLDDPAALARALDLFRTTSGDHVVGADWEGSLRVAAAGDGRLPPGVAEALRAQRALADVPPRVLHTEGVHLLAWEALVQTLDAPGLDDPLELSGRLTGPWLRPGVSPTAARGRLTVSRAQLLGGLVHAVEHRFVVLGSRAAGTRPGHAYHVPLAVDPACRELVLAYPVDASAPDAPGNEARLRRYGFEALQGLQADLASEGAAGLGPLPVPDLEEHRALVRLGGGTVEGDQVRVAPPAGASWLVRLARLLFPERAPLPEEADALRYAALAQAALERLPPAALAPIAALRARIRQWRVSWAPELMLGLRPVSVPDGRWTIDGDALRLLPFDEGGRYLYLDVEDGFAREAVGDVELEVEHRGPFRVEYSGPGGAYTPGPLVEGAEWRSSRVTLPQARLDGAQNGAADLRLAAPKGLEVRVATVRMRAPDHASRRDWLRDGGALEAWDARLCGVHRLEEGHLALEDRSDRFAEHNVPPLSGCLQQVVLGLPPGRPVELEVCVRSRADAPRLWLLLRVVEEEEGAFRPSDKGAWLEREWTTLRVRFPGVTRPESRLSCQLLFGRTGDGQALHVRRASLRLVD